MAADSLPFSVLGGGASGSDLLSGRSSLRIPTSVPASSGSADSSGSSSSTASGSGAGTDTGSGARTGASGSDPARTNSSGSQSAHSPPDRSSASGSGGAKSGSSGSKSAGKGASAGSGNTSGAARSGRQTGRSSGASKSGTTQSGTAAATQAVAQAAAGTTDFSAALAQSLAATPANTAATPDASAGKPTTSSDADESGDTPTTHSVTDPASSALTLLQQALAAALVGTPAAPAASTTAASTSSTLTSGTSSSDATAINASGNGTAPALEALLTQNLTSDGKSGAASPGPAAAPSAAATGAGVANTAAAALTAAAQLPSAPHALQTAAIDSSRMALSSPVGTSAWTDELGTKLTWMANQGLQSASIQLSPEHLGPLQVSISVHDGQASVWFGAAQADTRSALQQSLPQLRQLFANQGLTLADAGVSRESPRGQSQQSSGRAATPLSGIAGVSCEGADARTSITGGLGLLDTYA